MNPRRLSGLADIAGRFDAAILDQWGVLHDGAKAPPGAIEAVAALVEAGKRLLVLSNSARLGSDAAGRLADLGYDLGWFAGIVTSGETVRTMLRDRTDPFFAALGRSVFLIARDSTLIDDPSGKSDYRAAAGVEDADFILLGSSTAPEKSLAGDYAVLLDRAVARGLPLVCANPDKVGVAAMGLIEAPGKLAAYYEQAGGIVRYVGKPYPEVYARCRMLLDGVPPGRILAVGDSLEHDIAGGWRAGCPTVFVERGIHAADLETPDGLKTLSVRFGVTPDFTVPWLAW